MTAEVGRGGEQDTETQSETAGLEAKLARYPADRYPAQHATTAFHLATVHLHRGRLATALPLLGVAYDIFGRLGMRLEQAKALTMRGVALRDAGRSDLAGQSFERAAKLFAELGQPTEEAAASYDLGLALQDQGEGALARAAMTRAYELFLELGHPAQAGAAARERGVWLLTSGEVETAVTDLEEAASLAERGRDLPGLGAAANALGLAQLAREDSPAAAAAFARAVGAFPRSLRAAEHAMAKANLAVAYERMGNVARARLAARQALAVPSADPPVRAQAQRLLDRLSGTGPAPGDLLAVLQEEPVERWPVVIREEVLRWGDAPPAERLAGVGGLVDGLLSRPESSYDLAESLIAVLVELPPDPYADLVDAVVEVTAGLAPTDENRVRAVMGSAMARFAMPQWQRLAGSLNAAAAAAGHLGGWR